MADAISVVVGWDLAKRPSVTVKEIVYVLDDGSIAIIPAGTEIDMPEIQNVHTTGGGMTYQPCPSCGSTEVKAALALDGWYIDCCDCHKHGQARDTLERAEIAWNFDCAEARSIQRRPDQRTPGSGQHPPQG